MEGSPERPQSRWVRFRSFTSIHGEGVVQARVAAAHGLLLDAEESRLPLRIRNLTLPLPAFPPLRDLQRPPRRQLSIGVKQAIERQQGALLEMQPQRRQIRFASLGHGVAARGSHAARSVGLKVAGKAAHMGHLVPEGLGGVLLGRREQLHQNLRLLPQT
eukprot:scaffold2544_cov245-Pinguiococcus_pyrenoidosus.AAC.12